MEQLNRIFCIALLCFSILLISIDKQALANSSAIVSENPHSRLDIFHLKRIVKDSEGNETLLLPEKPPLFYVNRDGTAELVIMDNNPLLFQYEDTLTITDSEDFGAVKNLISVFGELIKKISDEKKAAAETKAKTEETDPVAMLKEAINDIKKCEKQISDAINLTCGTEKEIEQAKTDVGNWKLYDIKRKAETAYDGIKSELDNNAYTKGQTIKLLGYEEELYAAIKSLKKFKNQVEEVHTGYKLKNTIDTQDTRKEYTETITIKANKEYIGYFKEKAILKQQEGILDSTLVLRFQRKSYFRYSIAPGIVYSFVENPKYKVKEDKDGNRTIAEDSSDYNEFAAGAVVNIIPEKYYHTSFEPFLQIGAAASGDDIGFLLGLGCSLFPFENTKGEVQSSLTLSGGAIYQQVDELTGGLNVGDNIKTDDELKTEKKFDLGFYLMLGVAF